MANPNIVNVSSILGKTDTFALTTTLTTTLLTCATDKVYKINSIMIANIDGTNAADVTITYNDQTNTRAIASTISVPADATLSVIDTLHERSGNEMVYFVRSCYFPYLFWQPT